ncbi:hypothetical protein [Sphingobacterium sp. NPDC055346]
MEKNLFIIIKNTFIEASNNHEFGSYHISLFLYLVELSNKLHWRARFSVPTDKTMDVLSIGSYKTYKKYLLDLEKFGAIKIIEFSKNQYTSLVIELNTCFGSALVKNTKADPKQVQYNNTIKTIKTNKNYIYLNPYFLIFQNFYSEEFNTLYLDSDYERKRLESLTEKLEQFRESTNDGREPICFFEDFLKNILTLSDSYYHKNFSLTMLDSKFNDIITHLKNNKNRSSKEAVYFTPKYWQPRISN